MQECLGPDGSDLPVTEEPCQGQITKNARKRFRVVIGCSKKSFTPAGAGEKQNSDRAGHTLLYRLGGEYQVFTSRF
jgi:hypothetical protein